MRSDLLVAVGLGAALTACATMQDSNAVCAPIASWSAPVVRCAAPPPPIAVAPPPPPEPVKPEPEPEPPAPPPGPVQTAEVKTEKIELSETVQFETDSAVLVGRSKTLLDEVVKALNDHPEVKRVVIEGYTDAKASKAYNLKLSEQRVASVKAYLVEKGIDGGRLRTKGFGEARPIASNKTEEGRAKNRRVDFRISERHKR